MGFGEILDEWERIKRERERASASAVPKTSPSKPSALEAWLDANPVHDKDAELPSKADRDADARRLASMKPQARLDLHGMTANEAAQAIAVFIDEAARGGLEKVLIIHGKGNHSERGPVLKRATRKILESHRRVGRFGQADKADGGSGALWVYIRSKV